MRRAFNAVTQQSSADADPTVLLRDALSANVENGANRLVRRLAHRSLDEQSLANLAFPLILAGSTEEYDRISGPAGAPDACERYRQR